MATKSESEADGRAEMDSDTTEDPGADGSGRDAEHDPVPRATRAAVLDEHGHRCQMCGRVGPEADGLATLHIHHIERDPDDMNVHDPANLTVLCRSCHSWFHNQASPEDVPVDLTEEDRAVLLPQDLELVELLAAHGPMRTGDIMPRLTADLSMSAVRERLWVLMGLDNRVESRDRQLVDKDVETGEWGLADHIETSARGHIPDATQKLIQRVEDEQVRQAIDRGCDRQTVADVFGVTRRTTFNKTKRAYAYDFPLGAFDRGRPCDETRSDEDTPATSDTTGDTDSAVHLARDDDGGDADESGGRTETWGTAEAASAPESAGGEQCPDQGSSGDEFSAEVRAHLQAAIDSLEGMGDAV